MNAQKEEDKELVEADEQDPVNRKTEMGRVKRGNGEVKS